MLRAAMLALLRTLALAVALLVGAAVAAAVAGPTAGPVRPDEPLSAGAAFLIVNVIGAAVLAALATHARVRGVRLALALFGVAFGAQTVLTQIETVMFNASVRMSAGTLARVVLVSAVSFACAAVVAPRLFRSSATSATVPPVGLAVRGVGWRVALLAVAFVGVYFGAGAGIAWRSAAVRAYYADGVGIATGPLVALQLARGALWAGLALVVARWLARDRAAAAGLCALAFAGLVAAPLLYPNPYMPWPVRAAHLLEIAVSNACFGAVAGWLLAPAARGARDTAVVRRRLAAG